MQPKIEASEYIAIKSLSGNLPRNLTIDDIGTHNGAAVSFFAPVGRHNDERCAAIRNFRTARELSEAVEKWAAYNETDLINWNDATEVICFIQSL